MIIWECTTLCVHFPFDVLRNETAWKGGREITNMFSMYKCIAQVIQSDHKAQHAGSWLEAASRLHACNGHLTCINAKILL